ncbi:unnamed protein product [Diatraea saccharalis]|uniref:THAP-type domain-containing protein n=1 Tax=Diatraea saccharalis TaxID=40085 RepID=A0A9N9R526_9NEOP|nr:unnamed protein product [Diatraea saccharalis]
MKYLFYVYRLPQNEQKKEIWLEVIGKENIRLDIKQILICSLHFHESSFNRTLDVSRLKDDAVPALFLQQPLTAHQAAPKVKDHNVESCSEQNLELVKAVKKLNRLQEKVNDYKKKIKCLNETVRRQKNKITTLKEVIKELKEKELMTHENCLLLEQCAGPKDLLLRQISKAKGLLKS